MPKMLPRSTEMSVRSLVQAFGKVARPKGNAPCPSPYASEANPTARAKAE
jgi:hypothetical protein